MQERLTQDQVRAQRKVAAMIASLMVGTLRREEMDAIAAAQAKADAAMATVRKLTYECAIECVSRNQTYGVFKAKKASTS